MKGVYKTKEEILSDARKEKCSFVIHRHEGTIIYFVYVYKEIKNKPCFLGYSYDGLDKVYATVWRKDKEVWVDSACKSLYKVLEYYKSKYQKHDIIFMVEPGSWDMIEL